MIIIKEEKQVGTLYHFTEIDKLEKILYDNGLKSNDHSYISFSRNYDLTRNAFFSFSTVRLTFDGNKLSSKFKIEPFLDKDIGISRHEEEFEERILWPQRKVLPCFFAIKQIDILDRYSNIVYKELIDSIKVPTQIVAKFKPVK